MVKVEECLNKRIMNKKEIKKLTDEWYKKFGKDGNCNCESFIAGLKVAKKYYDTKIQFSIQKN